MINILLSSCFAWIAVNVLEIHHLHRLLHRKPFACDVCLSGWVALFYCWGGWYTPGYMAAAMVCTILINKVLK